MEHRRSGPSLLALLAALVLAAGSAGAGGLAQLMPSPMQMAPLRLVGSVESYTPESLWERINGEAELYRLYGLTGAAIGYFEDPGDAERGMEVSLFRLSDPLGAYGLFAAFRGPDGDILDLGNGGIADDSQMLFWHGEHFVQLHAYGTDATRKADLRRTAEVVSAALGTPPAFPEILTRLSGQVESDTVQVHPNHLFGRAALPPGLSGTTTGGAILFVATAPHEDHSELAAYFETLVGSKPLDPRALEGVTGRDPDLGPMALAIKDNRLIGVRGAVPESELGNLFDGLTRVFESP